MVNTTIDDKAGSNREHNTRVHAINPAAVLCRAGNCIALERRELDAKRCD